MHGHCAEGKVEEEENVLVQIMGLRTDVPSSQHRQVSWAAPTRIIIAEHKTIQNRVLVNVLSFTQSLWYKWPDRHKGEGEK